MRVLIVVTNADLAGAPIHVRDLALGILEKGFAVAVVFGENGPIRSTLAEAGIETYLISTMHSNLNPFQDLLSCWSLMLISRKFLPDIIHCHSSKAGLISRVVCLFLNIPVIYTIHGWGFGEGRQKWKAKIIYFTERLMVNFTTSYIAVSEVDRYIGLNELHISKEKIITIHNGIPYPSYDLRVHPQEFTLIMVARNDPQKDYITFFKSLKTAIFERAYIIGRGTDSPKFIGLARKLAGENFQKILFLGPRDDVSKWLEKSSVFLLISNFEGLPISVIEAMSKGLPIIATDVGGVSEMVMEGCNGFLVSRGDFETISQKISLLSADRNLSISMGKNSIRNFLSSFTSKSMISKVINLYHEII